MDEAIEWDADSSLSRAMLRRRRKVVAASATAIAGSIQTLTLDRKSTRLNSSHVSQSRMPSSA